MNNEIELKCDFCERKFDKKKALASHKTLCKNNPTKKDSPFVKWNILEDRVKSNQWTNADYQIKDETREKLSKKSKLRVQTEETKAKISVAAKKNGLGGVTQSRRIKYKGKSLGSSYELKIAQDLDKYEIRWDTCGKFNYIDPTGKDRTYTPDIYLIDYDVYLDPKNDFLLNNINPALGFTDIEKIDLVQKQNGIKVVVLNKSQLCWEEIKKYLK
jgi:hypothetical protein